MSGWQAGALSGDRNHDIHDELIAPDGRCVAFVQCFSSNPDVYYCNAMTPDGEWRRLGAGFDYQGTRDWAERQTGLKPKK